MIGDPECLFVIAMDISGPHSNKNPQLHIMNRVSYIKTQVTQTKTLVTKCKLLLKHLISRLTKTF